MHCYRDIITDQTMRSIWSVGNVIACIPDRLWEKTYCGMPLWKHVYHTLHSLDMWYINPYDFKEPAFHTENLNDLDSDSGGFLSRSEINAYYAQIKHKIIAYLDDLNEGGLFERPQESEYTRFHHIMAQHRHLDMHTGMLMGYIIAETGKWPEVKGLLSDMDGEPSGTFF